MGLEVMACCGALTHVYGDAGKRKHNAGCHWLEPIATHEEVQVLRGEIAALKFVIRQLVELTPCRFDQDGGCQEHGFINYTWGEKCPQQQAKDVLGIDSTT